MKLTHEPVKDKQEWNLFRKQRSLQTATIKRTASIKGWRIMINNCTMARNQGRPPPKFSKTFWKRH